MLYVSPMKYDDCSEFDPLPKVKPLLDERVTLREVEPLELGVRARKESAVGRAALGDRGAPRFDDREVIGIVLGRDRHGLLERELGAAG